MSFASLRFGRFIVMNFAVEERSFVTRRQNNVPSDR